MDEELQNHITQLLKIQNEDNEIRMEGESYIKNLQTNFCYDLLRLSCSLILSDQEIPNSIVQLSFILINQNRLFLMNNWSNLTSDQHNILRTAVSRGMLFQDQAIRGISSLTFSLITKCGIDVFKQDLFEQLAAPICNTEYEPYCTIGCFMVLKELVHQKDIIQVDFPSYQELGQTVTDAFVKIMSDPTVFEISDFIIFLDCYSTILPFFQTFYQNDESLTSFLNLIYSVLHVENADIHSALYILLFSFFKCFYDHIDACMDLIFEMTVNSLNMPDSPDIIRPAIDFWFNVAQFEIEKVKLIKAKEKDITFHNIAAQAAPNLIDLLMLIVTKFAPESVQPSLELESIEMMNSNSVCQSAIDCLREFSNITGKIFAKLGPEFDQRIVSSDWHDRIAAIYSLWCISNNELNSFDVTTTNSYNENQIMFELNQFYQNRFPALIQLSNDPVEVVRIEAFSFLAVIFRVDIFICGKRFFLRKIISHLNQIVFGLKKRFIKGEMEPVSDILFGRICDILFEIGKQNKKKRDRKDIVYHNNNTKKKRKKKKNPETDQKEDEDAQKEDGAQKDDDDDQEEDDAQKDDDDDVNEDEGNQIEDDAQKEDDDDDVYKIIGNKTPQTVFSIYYFKFLRILFNIFDFPIFQGKSYTELQERCTQAINVMFLATPKEQVSYVLSSYIPIICGHIESHFQILENPQEGSADENIDSITRIRQLCIILSSIIEVAGTGITEYSEQILVFLIKCLTMKSASIHEEALICLKDIVNANALCILPCFQKIIEIFFISQDCDNNFIVSESANLLLCIFENIENCSLHIDQNIMKSIFDTFIKNLKDDSISLKSRLIIVNVFGRILKILKIAAEPFFSLYVEVLTNYQNISFSFFLEEEVEEASLLYITILNGYGDLLEASIGLEFFLEYIHNFRSIILFVDSIGKFGKCLNTALINSILNYISTVFEYLPEIMKVDQPKLIQYKRIRGLINRKFKPILEFYQKDYPKASSLLDDLDKI